MQPKAMIKLITVQLQSDHPLCLAWARDNGVRPHLRWAVREVLLGGRLQAPIGQELVTYRSWTEAREAIASIEAEGRR